MANYKSNRWINGEGVLQGRKAFIRKNFDGVMHPGMLAMPDGPYEALAAYLMLQST